jgi:PAS domain-containing protein
VDRDPELAAWLVAQRSSIERLLAARLGEAAPAPAAPESEALRRFRSFAAAALQRGAAGAPSLDGLRVSEARVAELLEAWSGAAVALAGERGAALQAALAPLVARFRAALRETEPARRRSGAPRIGRRAVSAAIDRIADAFLAIDVDARRIVDANPAAGALLGTARDQLVGAELAAFLPAGEDEVWWSQLDGLAESGDARRFAASLCDARGERLAVEASFTRYARGGRLLALALLRPTAGPGAA